MKMSLRARLILRHIATSKDEEVSLSELVRFSPVDGDIVDRKAEARENASAVEELIQKELVRLWVVDRWPLDLYLKEKLSEDPTFLEKHQEKAALAVDLMLEGRSSEIDPALRFEIPPEIANRGPEPDLVLHLTESGQAALRGE